MSGQASTSTNTPSATVQPGRGKVKLPDNYTGDRIESQKFMLQCLLLFAAESDRYKTDQDKISLVLSCMRYGTAGAWAENFLLKSVGADPPTDLGTWKDFLAKFKLQFRETGKTDKARSALMAFSQGRMTVDEYSNQFILIAADADISDKEQVPYFQRGLDPRVMDKIYDKEVQPKDTIQDWINTACEIDGRLRARTAQKAILANSTSFRSDYLNRFHNQISPRYNSTNAPRRMNNQVVDMDIDATRKRNAESQKRKFDGKRTTSCSNCGKPGHSSANCWSPRRGVRPVRGNSKRRLGTTGRGNRAVDLEGEDDAPAMGNQAGIYRGMETEDVHRNNQRVPQPGPSMERPHSTPSGRPQTNHGQRTMLSNGRRGDGGVSHSARIGAVLGELGEDEAREVILGHAERFS
ncbi:hypothetical protein HETIRDRAFT_330248 [Heterobasidion irregulare TC 32-1]|uniref:CCHC-type domain-containing protein n=1 Tax=Heterobasidion irregulare (strain TC 32-1) TaxID=747525 RepID=W4JQ76_HETIT|nr:uncharacterized protein HETIRDRAFT_330248 [Heterobasidion irregulare TC 32-1]ETW75688.1 hypothetical protein HETIRDRAFT_330248 [Heterobasidion irregulare TC 32-1]